MKCGVVSILASLALLAGDAGAQKKTVVTAGGEVARVSNASRLTHRISAVDASVRSRVRVTGDSAQRIAMDDFEWKGNVSSVELDELDTRLFWDVKIVSDRNQHTLVRYRIDAASGGILDIKEFQGIRGLVRQR